MGLLDNDLRIILGQALDFVMLDLTVRRITQTIDPVTGLATVASTVDYSARGFTEEYTLFDKARGVVQENDLKVLIMQTSLPAIVPIAGDRVLLNSGAILATVVRVSRDPANATWELQVRK